MAISFRTKMIPPDQPLWNTCYRVLHDTIITDPHTNRLEAPWILGELNGIRGLLVGMSFFPIEGKVEFRTHEGSKISAHGYLTIHLPPDGKEEHWRSQTKYTMALITETAQRQMAGCLVKYPETAIRIVIQYSIKLSSQPPGESP